MLFEVGTNRLYPRRQFFYHAGMKKTRFRLRLFATIMLWFTVGTVMAVENPAIEPQVTEPPAVKASLAAALYQQQLQAGAANFGQCLGSYVLPPQLQFKQELGQNSQGRRPVTAELDQLTGNRQGAVRLKGEVMIRDGARTLLAEEVLYNQVERQLKFPQGFLLEDGPLLLQGEHANLLLDGAALELGALQWLMPAQGLRGTATSLRQSDSGNVLLTDAQLTRCLPGNDSWSLAIKELEINEVAGYAQARGAVLRVKSVPVGYVPRLRVSLDGNRTSGWQMPSGGISSRDGLELRVPYYWEFSPRANVTVAPRWISRRGVGIDGRLLAQDEFQSTAVDMSYLASDNLYNGLFDRKTYKALGGANTLGSFRGADRWLLAVDHLGRLGPLRTRVDFARSSDRDIFRDLDSYVGLTNPNALKQLAQIAYASDHWDLRAQSLGFQRLDELDISDYESSPLLSLGYRSNAFGEGLDLAVQAQWAQFNAAPGLVLNALPRRIMAEGSRLHIEPTLSYRQQYAGGFWMLRGGYKLTRYEFDGATVDAQVDAQADRSVGFFSADAGLFFDRDLNLGGRDLVQTLEPRVFYLRQEFAAQQALPVFDSMPLGLSFDQLFSDDRFAGLDRVGDANRITVAATSRVLNASGRELLTMSAGYLRHFSDPRVRWPESFDMGAADIGGGDLVALAQTINFSQAWQMRGRQLWQEDLSAWQELGAVVHLRGSGQRVYNFGVNRRLLDQIEQAEVSAYLPLSQHVAVTGSWHYDLENHRTLEAFFGVEYDDCCLRLRLVAQQYLENPSYRNFGLPQSLLPRDDLRTDRGILLEVQLKGLAGFGSKVDALLRRSVYGYDSQYRLQ